MSNYTQIEDIHAHPLKGMFTITGGGTQLIGSLLKVPGGSDTVLQALVPYSAAALNRNLGFTPPKACSEETARWMAMRAYQLALEESMESADTVFGLAVTASLASLRVKKGQHRIHIAAQTRSTTFTWLLVLKKGHRSREEEEVLCHDMALNALCEIMQLKPFVSLELHNSETILSHSISGEDDLQQLLFSQNNTKRLLHYSQSQTDTQAQHPELVFPGAFNPLHDGHKSMIEMAKKITGLQACFELCVHNIEKPGLDFISLAQRCEPFKELSYDLILTTASRFVDKARCFPSAIFIVGIDTLERIADPQFYDGCISTRDEAIAEIDRLGCRFLVFGRVLAGEFKQLENIIVPARLEAICSAVPESAHRMDISSTEVRNKSSG